MDVARYLERIQYDGRLTPTMEILNTLQRQHVLHIPFENLDIHYKTPINLDINHIFEKVVGRKRGGFCYELNGLFFELLMSIGFNVKMVSARVFNNEQQTISAEFDHLAIIATIASMDYLVDVGFGEFALQPLKIELEKNQNDPRGAFRIEKYDGTYYKVSKLTGDQWIIEYIFSLKERQLDEFKEMCQYHQTSPQSHFTQNKLCSLATENGRITLTTDKIKIKEGDTITERALKSEEDFLSALEEYFNISLQSSFDLAGNNSY